ncbi:MAG: GH3 auxin-responsive promoter family protein [Robiginitalea sp.]
MAIFGKIVKGLLEIRDRVVPELNPLEAQEEVLRSLLDKAKHTEFGRKYHFQDLLQQDSPHKAFTSGVPSFDFHSMYRQWWHRLEDGAADVTWPGSPDYFALSSGTTGTEPKRIPVTAEMLNCIRKAGIRQIYALAAFDLPAEFYEKDFLMLGSSTDLETQKDWEEGEISGISAANIPGWFQGFYKPGSDIAAIDDWDERVKAIARGSGDWDVAAISGIPSWIELMLKEVIAYHEAENIHQVWPDFQVYTSGGVAFEPYRKSFEALLAKPIQVIDTYLASEGFLAFQARPETRSMKLITDNGIYFEFVPFDPQNIREDGSLKQGVPSLGLSEVTTGRDYILLISTVSGAWRYMIGDTIQFTDVERTEIRITGRTKFFLNTVGSQLSVNKLNDAVTYLESELGTEIPEYTICAYPYDGDYYHHWYLGIAGQGQNSLQQAHKLLDSYLKEANKNYKVARGRALKGVKVTLVRQEAFYQWQAQRKKKGGQVKMQKVMEPETFKEWREFASAYELSEDF